MINMAYLRSMETPLGDDIATSLSVVSKQLDSKRMTGKALPDWPNVPQLYPQAAQYGVLNLA